MARREWASARKRNASYDDLHRELLASGVLAPQGEVCVFTSSYGFSSPSAAAAAVVHGHPANGRIGSHVRDTQKTYYDWKAAKLAVQRLASRRKRSSCDLP